MAHVYVEGRDLCQGGRAVQVKDVDGRVVHCDFDSMDLGLLVGVQKIIISPGAPQLAPRASACGSIPGPAFGTSLCIKRSAPSSLSSDDSLSDSDSSSSMCLST